MLNYIGQLSFLPLKFGNLQRHAFIRILHLPGNALSLHACHELNLFGGPRFRCALADNLAALYRTAFQTVHEWRFWVIAIQEAAPEMLPLSAAVQGSVSPAFWDSQPFCFNLLEAYRGFPRHPKVKVTIDSLIEGSDMSSDIRLKKGLQRVVYSQILSTIHPPTLQF